MMIEACAGLLLDNDNSKIASAETEEARLRN
jgi:hypothetical protein